MQIEFTEDVYVNFYQGAYGPTIIIALKSQESLLQFVELIKALKSNCVDRFDFLKLKGVRCNSISSFIFRNKEASRYGCFKLKNKNEIQPTFEWIYKTSGWQEVYYFIEGLVENDGAAHAYLAQEQVSNAMIVLSRGEGYTEKLIQ